MKTDAPRRKPQWRHQTLADTLFRRIAAGEYPVGDTLPTERDIAAAEKVSRATVREALRYLENHGMIRRRQGSGTVVIASKPQQLRMHLNSLEALLTYPRETEIVMAGSEPLATDDPAFAQAELDPALQWRRISFMRHLRGATAPVSQIDVFLLDIYAEVEKDIQVTHASVYEMVEKRYDVHPAKAIVRIDAVQLDERLAQAFGVEEGTAAVRIQRRYSDADGRLYQVSVSIYPQDRYVFETVINS